MLSQRSFLGARIAHLESYKVSRGSDWPYISLTMSIFEISEVGNSTKPSSVEEYSPLPTQNQSESSTYFCKQYLFINDWLQLRANENPVFIILNRCLLKTFLRLNQFEWLKAQMKKLDLLSVFRPKRTTYLN